MVADKMACQGRYQRRFRSGRIFCNRFSAADGGSATGGDNNNFAANPDGFDPVLFPQQVPEPELGGENRSHIDIEAPDEPAAVERPTALGG